MERGIRQIRAGLRLSGVLDPNSPSQLGAATFSPSAAPALRWELGAFTPPPPAIPIYLEVSRPKKGGDGFEQAPRPSAAGPVEREHLFTQQLWFGSLHSSFSSQTRYSLLGVNLTLFGKDGGFLGSCFAIRIVIIAFKAML